MITQDDLQQIEGLNEDQVSKIVELAENSKSKLIKEAQKKAWDSVDEAIEQTTGIKKEQSELTSAYAKRVGEKLAGDLSTIQSEADTIKGKLSEYEEKIKSGKIDEASQVKIKELETSLKAKNDTLEKLRADVKRIESEKEKEISKERSKNETYRLGSAFGNVESGISFKEDLDPLVKSAVIKAAREAVLSKGKPKFNEDGTVNFLNEENMPITNPDNLHNPYLLSELYKKELSPILKAERQQGGGGGKNNNANNGLSIDLTGVKTKDQARLVIKEKLISDGIAYGSEEYRKAEREAFSKLPEGMPTSA